MVKIKMNLDRVAAIVSGLGALTWGTDKVLGFDGIDMLMSTLGLTGYATLIYGAVGLAGAWTVWKIWN